MKRITPRLIISRILMWTGALLIASALIYEGVNYPWKVLTETPEQLNAAVLPDPTPPALEEIELIIEQYGDEDPYAEETEPSEQEELEDAPGLPGQGDNIAGGIVQTPKKQEPLVILGAIKIPKLDVSVNVLKGSSQRELLFGAGHVSGSAKIGGKGNIVISGHRVTARMHPFRHLDKMAAGDTVIIKNDSHTYSYETIETFIVGNTETWVMQRVEEEKYCLTLITCHPVGSARQRLILRARLKTVDDIPVEEFYAPKTEPEPSAEPEPELSAEPAAEPEPSAEPDPATESEPEAPSDSAPSSGTPAPPA